MFGGQEVEHVEHGPPGWQSEGDGEMKHSALHRRQKPGSLVSHQPVADLGAGRAAGVERRLVALLRLVEAEAVAAAVAGAVELLQQEDHGLVDDAQHPQSVDTCRKGAEGRRVHLHRQGSAE